MNCLAPNKGERALSLAVPPLYVVRTVERCPECGEPMHVFALGCELFIEAGESTPSEEFYFLHHIRSLPDLLVAMLASRCRGYRFAQAAPGEDAYLTNHCRCGARLDDEFLHGDVGTAFWPDTPEGFARLRLFRLPIRDAIQIESSYTAGGGEYLDFATAESW
jgi:hypothetical protein